MVESLYEYGKVCFIVAKLKDLVTRSVIDRLKI